MPKQAAWNGGQIFLHEIQQYTCTLPEHTNPDGWKSGFSYDQQK